MNICITNVYTYIILFGLLYRILYLLFLKQNQRIEYYIIVCSSILFSNTNKKSIYVLNLVNFLSL